MYLAYNTAAVEKVGKPVVMMVSEFFANDCQSAASRKELPGMRFVPTTIPAEVGAEDLRSTS